MKILSPSLSRAGFAALVIAGSMSAVVPGAVAGGATTTTERSRQVDVNPGETNPCNGSIGTITNDEQDVFHITELADGTYHLTGHSTARVSFEPDDSRYPSYVGHETFSIAESSNSRNFTTTSTHHVRVKGTDRSFITISEVVHISVSASGVSVTFERPTFSCS